MATLGAPAHPSPEPCELSVVVPTRNEAANVDPLLARLRAALGSVRHELVVVDDSDDATAEVLAARAGSGLRLQHRPPSARAGGLSTAVVEGLRLARGRYVCVMDADLQHPPELVPELLATVRGGSDIAVASRYVAGGSGGGLDGAGRRLVSRLAGLVARALFAEARASTDPLSGFFCCRRDLVQGVELRPVGFKILLELLVCSPPLRVTDVPLRFAPRVAGESKASWQQGRLYLRHLSSLVRDVPGSARRWKFAVVGLAGLVVLLAALALGTEVLRLAPLQAWALAFVVSLALTFVANRRLTFADMRRDRDHSWTHYPVNAVLTGLLQLSAFAALLTTGWNVLAVGVLAAAIGMVANGVLNQRLVHRRSRSARVRWGPEPARPDPSPGPAAIATQLARAALDELCATVRAGDGALLLVRGGSVGPLLAELGGRDHAPTGGGPVPASLLDRVVTLQRAAVWTEAPSSRPQRRRNIDVHSVLVVPVARGRGCDLVLALTRDDPHPFDGSDLAAALAQVEARRELIVPPGWDAIATPVGATRGRWRMGAGAPGHLRAEREPGSLPSR
ncbi:MAG TPA: glycosyltransferase family 2 protein [Verrucomicrobiae bacterium]|nr:glycosyltransferase family 2 protein [Verrucomicrobiae bacterium]